MELKDPNTMTTSVQDSVCSQLFQTMTNWNSMIQDLQESTDFDVKRVSFAQKSSTSTNLSLAFPNDESHISDVAHSHRSMSTSNHTRGK